MNIFGSFSSSVTSGPSNSLRTTYVGGTASNDLVVESNDTRLFRPFFKGGILLFFVSLDSSIIVLDSIELRNSCEGSVFLDRSKKETGVCYSFSYWNPLSDFFDETFLRAGIVKDGESSTKNVGLL